MQHPHQNHSMVPKENKLLWHGVSYLQSLVLRRLRLEVWGQPGLHSKTLFQRRGVILIIIIVIIIAI